MMSHFLVFFCKPASAANTVIQDRTDGIRLRLRSVCRNHFIPASISCPLRHPLVSSPHLLLHICPLCSLAVLSATCHFPSFAFDFSVFHPSTQRSPAPVDPLIEISAQQAAAQREMLFRGNFWGGLATLSVPLQQAELSVELGFGPGRYNENVGDGGMWVGRSEVWGDDMCKHKRDRATWGKPRPVTSDVLMIWLSHVCLSIQLGPRWRIILRNSISYFFNILIWSLMSLRCSSTYTTAKMSVTVNLQLLLLLLSL